MLENCGVWCSLDASDSKERLRLSICKLRGELWSWYGTRSRTHPHEKLTRLADVTEKMFGKRTSKTCKLKGAEQWAFMLYLLDVMYRPATRNKLGSNAEALIGAAEALVNFMDIVHKSPVQMSGPQVAALLEEWKRHMALIRRLDVSIFTPKHHLMVHLILRAIFQGNPSFAAVWRDEGYNKNLKQCLRNVHQMNFESRGLIKFKALLDILYQKAQKR